MAAKRERMRADTAKSGIQNGFLAGRVPAQQKNGGKRYLRHNAPLRRPRQCAHVSGALENTGFRLKLRPPTRSQQDAFTRSKKAAPRAAFLKVIRRYPRLFCGR